MQWFYIHWTSSYLKTTIHLDLSDVVYLMYYMYDLYMCQNLLFIVLLLPPISTVDLHFYCNSVTVLTQFSTCKSIWISKQLCENQSMSFCLLFFSHVTTCNCYFFPGHYQFSSPQASSGSKDWPFYVICFMWKILTKEKRIAN